MTDLADTMRILAATELLVRHIIAGHPDCATCVTIVQAMAPEKGGENGQDIHP